ncbi:epimerase [Hamadaea sp. NPDC051192]|uniref:epimerase n=1 Tax=Hamadaea sp. NPDC051192 TaxID=3154940 RepID=UPI0034162207
MKIAIFGATGMIGQGALRESLLASDVTSVLTIGRTPTGQQHPKLREITHTDFGDLSPIAVDLADVDACFFCLGVSAVGMTEDQYRMITYDITLTAARTLAAVNPGTTFLYISGAGVGNSRLMWARVKSETERALLDLPLQAYMFRPALILPMHGIAARDRLYRTFYKLLVPAAGVLQRAFPGGVTTTDKLGRAMLNTARRPGTERVLENQAINQLA